VSLSCRWLCNDKLKVLFIWVIAKFFVVNTKKFLSGFGNLPRPWGAIGEPFPWNLELWRRRIQHDLPHIPELPVPPAAPHRAGLHDRRRRRLRRQVQQGDGQISVLRKKLPNFCKKSSKVAVSAMLWPAKEVDLKNFARLKTCSDSLRSDILVRFAWITLIDTRNATFVALKWVKKINLCITGTVPNCYKYFLAPSRKFLKPVTWGISHHLSKWKMYLISGSAFVQRHSPDLHRPKKSPTCVSYLNQRFFNVISSNFFLSLALICFSSNTHKQNQLKLKNCIA